MVEYSGRNIAGHPLLLVLKARRLAHQATVHVFLDSSGRLFPATPAGSVLNPASARSALAIGAVDVLTGELARYSSQGPTDDRRLKPEVSAPANTVSWAYAGNEGRFPGTSASCPHAAGFAALLKEMEPQTPVAELRLLVMRSVVPHGSPHPNSLYGFGEIDGQVPAVAKARALEIAASAPVEIPVEFGGIVAPGTLAELRQLSGREQDGPAVRIVTGRDLYQIGDEIAIGVSASEDSACLLFLRDATGSYSLLSPRDSALTLAKGEWLWLPGPGEGRLRIAGPEGSDELLLICAPHATPLDSAMRGGLAVASHSYQIVEARP